MHTANLNLHDLNLLWGRRHEKDGAIEPGASSALARRALELGEPLLACDICAEARIAPGISAAVLAQLRKVHGLALARSGALDAAREIAEELLASGEADEESLGLAGRIHKDLWQRDPHAPEARVHLQKASALYGQAYATSRGIWSGINAATLSLAGGDTAHARAIAQEIRATCGTCAVDDYWTAATLAECALIMGETAEARRMFAAIAAGRGDFGSLGSTRRNTQLILAALGLPPDSLDDVLPAPAIVTFTGHMLDRDANAPVRFEASRADAAGARIRELVDRLDARIGYASAACGGDILFIEAMLARGAEVHVVLPSNRDNFVRDSVAFAPGWAERFDNAMAQAASVTTVSNSAATPLAYAYVNRIVLGLARLRARHIGGRVAALALWDGAPGRFGGTGSAVRDWQAAGQGITCIASQSLEVRELPPAERSAAPVMADGGQRIVSMLFGDAVGFSKLEDHQVSVFVERFLGAVSLLVEASGAAPLTCNTWGDGLYFCFEHPGDAAELALRICEMVRATDWHALGLSKEMDIRIALHAGPAYDCVNPVTKSRDFTGAHVSRAARIEPVTPPGQVYSSQAFAALCECFGLRDYVCDYVGQLPLAKGYGTFPTFHLRRSGGEPQAAATRQPAAVPAAPA